ncbi:MAG: OmpH family outer membrane protein [Bacteroidetes bacterium]|nr:OmpH family outer membrane protein [Bacteroidota bacterium]
MKNISLVLNLILAAAVAFLFYKVYNPASKDVSKVIPVNSSGIKIVYVNNDSLYDNYTLFKNINKAFEEEKDSIDGFLKQRASGLEKEVMKYQKDAVSMTDQERMQREEQLTKVQQGLVEMRNQLLDQLGDKEKKLTDSIQTKINDFISKYSIEKGYTYILGYQPGSLIHYADSTFDITEEVLRGLNSQK